MPRAAEVVLAGGSAPAIEEVEDEREAEREDEEAPVAERAQQLVAEVASSALTGRALRRRSAQEASSSPAPPISMSRAAGKRREQSARIAASESEQREHDRLAAPLDGRHARQALERRHGRRSGSVARIVREPTFALISVGGPSATTCAVRHEHDAVGEVVGLLEVVRREEHRAPAGGEARASSSRTRAGSRRPSPPSARRARAGRGC